MDFFGHHITEGTLVLGPMFVVMGIGQYLFFKYGVSYSERTIEELNNNSFLGSEGTKRTPMGGKITICIGLTIFLVMFALDFFWGDKTEDLKMFQRIHTLPVKDDSAPQRENTDH